MGVNFVVEQEAKNDRAFSCPSCSAWGIRAAGFNRMMANMLGPHASSQVMFFPLAPSSSTRSALVPLTTSLAVAAAAVAIAAAAVAIAAADRY